MKIDKSFREIARNINDLKWNSFNGEWFENESCDIFPEYYEYYYAEEELYIVRTILDGHYMWLVKAKSPKEALIKVFRGEAI